MEALSRWGTEHNTSVQFPSSLASEIFDWFEEHAPPGAHSVGAIFTGVYYYDTYFWKVDIPLAYGLVQLSALDALSQMPPSIKRQLQSDHPRFYEYAALWIGSLDYAFGMSDLGNGSRLPGIHSNIFAEQLTASAHKELTATVRLLTEARTPNSKALETSRMATEMFLKAYIAIHAGLSEADAQRKFSHHLDQLAEECSRISNQSEFQQLAKDVGNFPPIKARYSGVGYDNQQLWSGYETALRTAVLFTRSLTDRDSRHAIQIGQ